MIKDGKHLTFYEVITLAVQDMSTNGFDSQKRVDYWLEQIAETAARTLTPEHIVRETLNRSLKAIYNRMIEKDGFLKKNPGVSKFTIDKLKPKLRSELDRRIMASAQLIRLNREAAIQKTLQRFSGWATSVPEGGSDVVDKNETKKNIRKSLAQLPFEERRVLIDQGHKFVSSISETIAVDGGALAAEWHSHWKQLNYNFRKDHKERDKNVYAVRGNWAISKGLMKPDKEGYTDDITKPGEEVYCRCFYRWIYNVRDLPKEMLTEKGKEELKRVQGD
jgi:hypothetical protein